MTKLDVTGKYGAVSIVAKAETLAGKSMKLVLLLSENSANEMFAFSSVYSILSEFLRNPCVLHRIDVIMAIFNEVYFFEEFGHI